MPPILERRTLSDRLLAAPQNLRRGSAEPAMSSTRRGFLLRTAVAGGAALVRRVVASLTGRSTAAYAAVQTTRSARYAITHGPFVGHLTTATAMVWARTSAPGVYQLTARGTVVVALQAQVQAQAEELDARRREVAQRPRAFWNKKLF